MNSSQRSFNITAVFVFVLAMCGTTPAAFAGNDPTFVGTTFSGQKCMGERVNVPHDYLQRASDPGALEVVEEHHFTEETENLESARNGSIVSNLHFTLAVWPNHHRALKSVLNYRLRFMGDWNNPEGPPAECYFQRAIKFSPNDPKPYMMYGMLLHKVGKYDDALESYKSSARLLPNDIITQYNMGLTLVELKKYEEARQVAERVYAVGFPLPGLKNKLKTAGYWKKGSEPNKASAQTETPSVESPSAAAAPSNI